MNNNDQHGSGQKQEMSDETKGSGHRGDHGQQSRDTSGLNRDGHEFPRTEESTQSNQERQGGKNLGDEGQSQASSAIGVGQGAGSGHDRSSSEEAGNDPSKQPLGSTNPSESHDSWRPSADPAAGDLATGSDRDDQTP